MAGEIFRKILIKCTREFSLHHRTFSLVYFISSVLFTRFVHLNKLKCARSCIHNAECSIAYVLSVVIVLNLVHLHNTVDFPDEPEARHETNSTGQQEEQKHHN